MSDTFSPRATTPSLPESSHVTSRISTPNTQADLSEREKRRAQNRENLRAHYGLQDKKGDTEDQTGQGKQLEGDPLDPGEYHDSDTYDSCLHVCYLDSPAFSPEKYYKHLIATASLPQLLRESVTLNTGE